MLWQSSHLITKKITIHKQNKIVNFQLASEIIKTSNFYIFKQMSLKDLKIQLKLIKL